MQINCFKSFPRKTILAAAIAGAGITGGIIIKNNPKIMNEMKITKECIANNVNPFDSYGRALMGIRIANEEKYPNEAAVINELEKMATEGEPYFDALVKKMEELPKSDTNDKLIESTVK